MGLDVSNHRSGRGSSWLWRHRGSFGWDAKVLFFVFLVMLLISLIAGLGRRV
jgi:hypothetical protein